MKDKSEIIFEAKDFERYYSGEMTGREMYALEKAALADPFLQDALDGYKYSRSAVAEMDSLQERLTNRLTEKKKSLAIPWNKNSFLKAAVLIAFLAGAAFIFLKQNNNKLENNTLASTSAAEIKEAKTDSLQPHGQNDLASQEISTAENSATPVIDVSKKTEIIKSTEDRKEIDKNVARSITVEESTNTDAIAMATPRVIKNEKLKDNFLIKGKVVNEQGEPIPFASIVTVNQQINTDIAGNYSAYIKDSSMYGNVVATGYMPQQKKLNPNLSQTIILNTDMAKADKISEVERTQAAKKSIESAKGASVQKAEEANINTALIPASGWVQYEQYLKDSVRYKNNTRAIVQLTFTVNEKGRPQEIKVIDGLCLPCNTEAIRLLQSGPDWKNTPKSKGLLKVQF